VYMAEQMQKPKTVVRLPLFWLWALLIALCSCGALALYAFQNNSKEGFWGNGQTIQVDASSPNYQTIP